MLNKTLLILFPILLLVSSLTSAYAVSCEDKCDDKPEDQKLTCLNEVQSACQAKLNEISGQKQTLAKTISYLNTQARITATQIAQIEAEIVNLETEISNLAIVIEDLEDVLKKLTNVFITKVNTAYKASYIEPIYLLFSSDGIGDFFRRYKYLKVSQKNDNKVIFDLEAQRTNFDQQKSLKETKQQEIEDKKIELVKHKNNLIQQQAQKQKLLEITKNDESRFQQLLAKAAAEYKAIQGIIAGKGIETKVKDVEENERIASIIPGESCNSSGSHLHFIVKKGSSSVNPFSYLRGGIDSRNCSGPGECSEGDPFNPSGDWVWPISPQIILTQGYGSTWAIRNTWVGTKYSFHDGIDIKSSSSNNVVAVKKGTLYRGSYKVGCNLQYVKVDHGDDLSTFYLHVNY